jgi:uncharacterized protein (UPF0218 family)
LIEGASDRTFNRLRTLIERISPPMVIAVGDTVSENMLRQGVPLQVMIIDNKTKRKPIKPLSIEADQTLYLRNPPGSLAEEAWPIIRKALREKGRTKVLVDGEEDLIALVVVLCAPENSIVVYGQPNEGVVAIRVTEETRELMHKILNAMEKTSKS